MPKKEIPAEGEEKGGMMRRIFASLTMMVIMTMAGTVIVAAKESKDATALMIAAEQGNKEMVESLLAKGEDINAKDSKGTTALMIAAEQGNKEIVELLLAKGADISAKDGKGKTALMIAAKKNRTEVMNLLQRAACHGTWVLGKQIGPTDTTLHYNPPRYSVNGTGEVGPLGLREELLVTHNPAQYVPAHCEN